MISRCYVSETLVSEGGGVVEIGRVAGTRGRNCLTLGRRNLKYSDLCRYPLYCYIFLSLFIKFTKNFICYINLVIATAWIFTRLWEMRRIYVIQKNV